AAGRRRRAARHGCRGGRTDHRHGAQARRGAARQPDGLAAVRDDRRRHVRARRGTARAAAVGGARTGADRLVLCPLVHRARGAPPMNEFLASDLPGMFVRFLSLSLLSVGGAISTAPEMHRYLVSQNGWLDDAGFTTSIAIAQAAPGPNLLFIAVLSYQVFGLTGAA